MSIFETATIGDLVGAGQIITSAQAHVKINGKLWATLNSQVAPHGPPPHDVAFLIQSSPFVKINGIGVVRTGHFASCGDQAQGTAHVRISS